MDDKIEWILTELDADGYTEADTNDVAWIINNQGSGDIDFRPDFVDLVLELDQEWEQAE